MKRLCVLIFIILGITISCSDENILNESKQSFEKVMTDQIGVSVTRDSIQIYGSFTLPAGSPNIGDGTNFMHIAIRKYGWDNNFNYNDMDFPSDSMVWEHHGVMYRDTWIEGKIGCEGNTNNSKFFQFRFRMPKNSKSINNDFTFPDLDSAAGYSNYNVGGYLFSYCGHPMNFFPGFPPGHYTIMAYKWFTGKNTRYSQYPYNEPIITKSFNVNELTLMEE